MAKKWADVYPTQFLLFIRHFFSAQQLSLVSFFSEIPFLYFVFPHFGRKTETTAAMVFTALVRKLDTQKFKLA